MLSTTAITVLIWLLVTCTDNKPIFRELNAEEVNVGSLEATEVSSLCMECGKDVSHCAFVSDAYKVYLLNDC